MSGAFCCIAMPTPIKLKNSQVKDKAPQPSDLLDGEIAVNTHADSPAIYLKDTAGTVVKIAGAGAIGGTPATETAAGIVELATAAETTTGTDNTRAVHPAGLKVELDKKAPLASPALTGTPTAPTAAAGTNTTQIATTAFVTAATPDASTTVKGIVQLADAAAITAGTAGRVVDAAQLKAAVAVENLWDRTGTVVSPANAGDQVHAGTGKLTVGGTAAAPAISLSADGTARFGPNLYSGFDGTKGFLHAESNSAGVHDPIARFWSTQGDGRKERAVLTTGGEFRLGDITGTDANIKLRANGSAAFNGKVNTSGLETVSAWPLCPLDVAVTSANPSASATNFWFNGITVGRIDLSATATSYVTSSDYRLKENVIPVADGITRLQQLKPSRFNFIADPGRTVDGFLAHEVQAVVPEAISGAKDEVDADGKPVYQGIDQSKLVPLLTAALQEAVVRIEALEVKVAALTPNPGSPEG